MPIRDKSASEMESARRAAGHATRAAKAARVAEIEANPIDWGKQLRGITRWYAKREREGWK